MPESNNNSSSKIKYRSGLPIKTIRYENELTDEFSSAIINSKKNWRKLQIFTQEHFVVCTKVHSLSTNNNAVCIFVLQNNVSTQNKEPKNIEKTER